MTTPTHDAPAPPDAESPTEAEIEAEIDAEIDAAPDELGPSRDEAHLYLHLQRVAFCLERQAARRAEPPDAALVARIGHEIEALDAYIDEQFPDRELPIARLLRRFGLDDAALRLLVAAAAPALDLSLARRFEAIAGRAQPTAGALVAATARDLIEERSALAALRQAAPLVRRRLIRLGASPDWAIETPLLHRPVSVPERVIDWLRGDTGFDPERTGHAAVLWSAAEPDPAPPRPTAVDRALDGGDGGRPRPLIVAGPALAGKASAVLAAARARGAAVLDVDLEIVAASPRPVDLLLDLVREAMLHDAWLLLRRADVASDPRDELHRALAAVLADGALQIALTTRGAWRDAAPRIAGARRVELDRAEAPTPPLGWDDLVVPEPVAQRLVELLAAIRHRAQVMDDWGFGRKLAAGRAVTALLSGPPGTGKTLIATLIARDLGLALFRVDLSRAAAGWSAETEHQLGLAFAEARAARAVVLLDDADRLLARHAGAALVQGLDEQDGVVLITAGDPSPVTAALGERLRFHIALPAPTAAERARLWQAMLPPEVPVAHDLDFTELAGRYELTGRSIQSAVVRAAYLAAGAGLPGLTNAILHRAAELECEAMHARR